GRWIEDHPQWSRKRLACELCKHWGWRDHRGRLKDFAARSLLLKLAAQGALAAAAVATSEATGTSSGTALDRVATTPRMGSKFEPDTAGPSGGDLCGFGCGSTLGFLLGSLSLSEAAGGRRKSGIPGCRRSRA